MAKLSDIEATSLLFGELGAAPTTPATGKWRLYTKADGLYVVDDAGTEYGPLAASGGSSPLTTKGDVYTYSTVDARLAVGTDGHVLTADSAEATGLKWAAAAGGGGMTLVDTWEHSVDGDTVTITFSSIASSYTDLLIVATDLRADDSGGSSTPTFRVGNSSVDTGSNYGWGVHYGGSTASGSGAATTAINLGACCAGAGATAGQSGCVTIRIHRYAQTGYDRAINWNGFLESGAYSVNGGGHWRGTTAIDVVALIADSGATNGFTAGRVDLYGLG